MAAGATYEKIQTTTLGSAVNSFTFSSISQSYTDLVLVVTGETTSTVNVLLALGNGSIDTGSNYSFTLLYGTGSALGSVRETGNSVINLDYFASGSGNQKNYIIHLMNYSNTSTYKTVLAKASLPNTEVVVRVGQWRSTSAIDTVQIKGNGSGNLLAAGMTATLYGIAAA
jgi:hypothetical protein